MIFSLRTFILFLALAVATIFVVQNLQPVALIFFNAQLAIQLPISIWAILAIAAGMFTSFLLQLLTQTKSQANPTVITASPPPPKTAPPKFSHQPPPSPEDSFLRDRKRGLKEQEPELNTPGENKTDQNHEPYEVQRPPQKSSQSGSVYSYTYKEGKSDKKGRIEDVYDADYRLLTPPYNQKPEESASSQESEDDNDDWI